MKSFKNFKNALSRNEMRNIFAGKIDPYRACGSQLDCNYQSPAFPCSGGVAPTCGPVYCTYPDGSIGTNQNFRCGV